MPRGGKSRRFIKLLKETSTTLNVVLVSFVPLNLFYAALGNQGSSNGLAFFLSIRNKLTEIELALKHEVYSRTYRILKLLLPNHVSIDSFLNTILLRTRTNGICFSLTIV